MIIASYFEEFSENNVSRYFIRPKHTRDHEQNAEYTKRLGELLPRIKAMAQRQFGEDFISLEFLENHPGVLDLKVGIRSKTRNKDLYDAFFGWLAIFDDEPEVSM